MLQIDGKAWPRRLVVRFDSNTPHDHPHSLVELSARSLASAGRHGRSNSTMRPPNMVPHGRRCSWWIWLFMSFAAAGSFFVVFLVLVLTTGVTSDLMKR